MLKYNVIIEPDAESGGFYARVPELEGVFAQGATEEECLAEAKGAIEAYLKAQKKLGMKVYQVEVRA